MFKKSLAALAVLAAFATVSYAADVTVYGKIDAGLKYLDTETTDFHGHKESTEALSLDSGVGQASRFGLKGSEDLGNGYKVSFKLENGFNVDDGTYKGADKNRLFDREASLSISSDWGKLTAGRYGSFSAAAGDYDIIYSRGDAFDGGHQDVLGFAAFPRMDNMLTYQTPSFAGFQLTAQYAFKADNSEALGNEGHRSADRFGGIAATYDIGALQTAVSYEQLFRGNAADKDRNLGQYDDARIVNVGANYDFGLFKLYGMGQYFEGMEKAGFDNPVSEMSSKALEGWGLHVGSAFDALAGHFDLGVYYVDAKANRSAASDVDSYYVGAVGRYIYSLTSRTNIRLAAGFDEAKWDHEELGTHDYKKDRYFGTVALTHNF